jgi:hypothetical protein
MSFPLEKTNAHFSKKSFIFVDGGNENNFYDDSLCLAESFRFEVTGIKGFIFEIASKIFEFSVSILSASFLLRSMCKVFTFYCAGWIWW